MGIIRIEITGVKQYFGLFRGGPLLSIDYSGARAISKTTLQIHKTQNL